MLRYDVLILGTPSYGEGLLPGKSTGVKDGSWEEFIPALENADVSGKLIALYGLGDQDKYPQRFADALINLYTPLKKQGASIIGAWSTDGYSFEQSRSVLDGKFVGLVIDHAFQGMLTDQRISDWLEQIKADMLKRLQTESIEEVA